MFDTFSSKKPLYPLVGFFTSICCLVAGLLFSKNILVFAFIGAMFLLYCSFGLFKAAWKMLSGAVILGAIVGGLAFLTSRNFASFWQTADRMLVLSLCAVPMVSIPPARLTRCLNMLKCPRMITIGMLVTLRFIPILISEIKQIREAMKVRGVNMSWYRIDRLYRAFFIPLVMRIIGISDTLSLSLETRGFSLEENDATVYCPVYIKARDIVFLVLLTMITVLTEVGICFMR